MLENDIGYLVELLFPCRIAFLFKSYKSLDFKLYRGERVFDLMRNLTCHLAPGLVALGLSQLTCRIRKVMHHSVVCVHE